MKCKVKGCKFTAEVPKSKLCYDHYFLEKERKEREYEERKEVRLKLLKSKHKGKEVVVKTSNDNE